MAKVWVLDTETKGTGAEMVPLDKVVKRRGSAPRPERSAAIRRRRAQERDTAGAGQPAEPRQPRRYRLVNAITGQVLVEDAGAREVVDRLQGMRSVVDARVYAWEPEAGEWRPLTLREQKRLWARRRQVAKN